MREVELHGDGFALERSFPGVLKIADQCRFANCTRNGESGCTVEAALREGNLTGDRYQSYVTLRNETQLAHQQERARWIIQAKRKKRRKKGKGQTARPKRTPSIESTHAGVPGRSWEDHFDEDLL